MGNKNRKKDQDQTNKMNYSSAIVLSLLGLTVSASGDTNKKMGQYLGYVG